MKKYGLSEKYNFPKAVPVWEEGTEKEMNRSLLLRAVVGKGNAKLVIAAHTRYQIFINGEFFAGGPARAAHGYYRVSEYELGEKLTKEENVVGIIAAGYNANSYYLLDEPSFVCAELIRDGKVLFATGAENGFEAIRYIQREQKVQRYSFQRPFTECYSCAACYDEFFRSPEGGWRTVKLVRTADVNFITRTSPYCENRETFVKKIAAEGRLVPSELPDEFDDRSFRNIGEKLKGFPEKELTTAVVNELYACDSPVTKEEERDFEPITVQPDSFAIFDMGLNTTGYIRLSLDVPDDAVVYAVFTEVRDSEEEGLDPGRMGCANVVKWTLEGGRKYDLVSFEPYTYRYIQLDITDSAVTVENISQYRETYPESRLVNRKEMPDEELEEIYAAAIESFVQNTTDIYMDCPSRERAGWLCDSYFTSRVERELTGESLTEHDFLENFLLPESFPCLPDGMLPMCYPSDHNDGVYIPNWAMWYALELREYYRFTGDEELIGKAKEKMYKLLAFFGKFENADGLLEKLESWIFVEWSKANEFVQDINYPTNMLYSVFLDSLAELYADEALKDKAEALRETIREKAFDGTWFCDNAVPDETGKAVRTENHTETCQYYAFFSGTATKESHPALYEKLLTEFGPGRDAEKEYPDVPVSNAFIGNYLRLQLLFSDGLYDKAVKEIRDFFLPMARRTGTLWENMSDRASCNHGFASHTAVWLNHICGK